MKKNIILLLLIFNLHSWSQTKITNSTSLISSSNGFDAERCLNNRYIPNSLGGSYRYACEGGSDGFYNNIYYFAGDIQEGDYVIVDFQSIKYINYIILKELSTGAKKIVRAGSPDKYIFLNNTIDYSIEKSTTPNGPWIDVTSSWRPYVYFYPTDYKIQINDFSRFWKITFKTPSTSIDICEPDRRAKFVDIYLQQIDFYETVLTPPTGTASQTICYGSTLSDLTVTGSTIKWYSNPSGGSFLPATTLIKDGTTYYASQTISGIETTERLAVTAIIQNIKAPTGLSPQVIAKGLTLSSIQVVGSNVKWYANQSNANQHINPIPSTTLLVNGNMYYATQTVNGCESNSSFGVVINLTIGLTDIDGNVYNTVDICDQTYTKENLNVSKYKNGDIIPGPLSATEWINTTSGAWKWYNSNDIGYGKLYNWYAVNDPRGLAPEGWHIPSDGEYSTLAGCLGWDMAGKKMKDVGNLHWVSPYDINNGTNESGFTALPGGFVDSVGHNTGLGYYCYLWSSSYGIAWYLTIRDDEFSGEGNELSYGYSVRCVKNSNLSTRISLTGPGGPAPAADWGVDYFLKDAGDGIWTANNIVLPGGPLKFRLNADWIINWGATSWPSGAGFQDGPNIPGIKGTYNVTFNQNTGEYKFFNQSLSIDANVLNDKICISPNPTHSVLNLSVNDSIILNKVTIVDITGKVVVKQTENLSKINVEQLAKGVYILTAYAGDKKYQEKFIKE